MTVFTQLDHAVSRAIMEHNRGKYLKGDFAKESHKLLGVVNGSDNGAETCTAYVYTLYKEYNNINGGQQPISGGSVPAAITFTVGEDGSYALKEYWEPRDGNFYADDIMAKFPQDVARQMLDPSGFIDELTLEIEN